MVKEIFAFVILAFIATVSKAKSPCSGLPHGATIPLDSFDCTKFIHCAGVPVIKSCPHNLHFNAIEGVCDFPDNAGCVQKNKKLHKIKHLKLIEADEEESKEERILECKEEGQLLRDTSACEKFIHCTRNERGARKFCPDGLHFSTKTLVCDWPERAGCA